MPTMQNIAVKDSANVDKTFTGISPGGPGAPAVWRREDLTSLAPGHRPTVQQSVRDANKSGTLKEVSVVTKWPVVVTDLAGNNSLQRVPYMVTKLYISEDVADASTLELVTQHTNFVVNATVKESFKNRTQFF